MERRNRPIVVVGGGLAGMSAALTLHEAGRSVLLLERHVLPGGRAGSFCSPALGGRLVDNSQHVLLGSCRELLAFYSRLGAAELIRFDRQIFFADEKGRRATIKAAPVRSPLHLLPSVLRFLMLSLGQRWEILRGMLQLASVSPAERPQFSSRTFASLLREWRQSPATVARFWEIVCVSALNESCESASAAYALQVFQETFLGARNNYQVGVATVPLSRLYERLPFPARCATPADGLVVEGGRVAAVMAPERLDCDAVILAVHPRQVAALVGPEVRAASPELQKLDRLSFSPIIGAHLLYDRPLLDAPHLALVGTRLQWVFADPGDPCLLHGVVSAPGTLVHETQRTLAGLFDAELRQVCPRRREARLQAYTIIKEKYATFRPLPGIDAFRPRARASLPGLFLAGDYTQTGWPSTMEGAAISGRLAAEEAMR